MDKNRLTKLRFLTIEADEIEWVGEGARCLGVGSLLIVMNGISASPKLPVRGRFLGDSGVSLARRSTCAGSLGRYLMGGGGGGGGRGAGGAFFCC